MANIVATEVQRQASRVIEQNTKFKSSSLKVYEELMAIATSVKSEDSDLASTIELYANAYNELKDKLTTKFATLADKMNTWATQTIQNEEKITKSLHGHTTEIETYSSLLNNLNK